MIYEEPVAFYLLIAYRMFFFRATDISFTLCKPLMCLLMSRWCFFSFYKLHLWCPLAFTVLCHPRVPFYKVLKRSFFAAESSLVWALTPSLWALAAKGLLCALFSPHIRMFTVLTNYLRLPSFLCFHVVNNLEQVGSVAHVVVCALGVGLHQCWPQCGIKIVRGSDIQVSTNMQHYPVIFLSIITLITRKHLIRFL